MDNLETNVKFGWKRNLEFIKVNFFIIWKKIVEYKANFLFTLIEHSIFITTHLLFFYLLINNFSEMIFWEFEDFLLFFILAELIFIIAGIFSWKEWLYINITEGDLNHYLRWPLKPIFSFTLSNLSHNAILYLILDLLIYSTIIIFYLNLNFTNIILATLIFFSISIMIILQIEFVRSFDFIKLKLAPVIWNPFWGFYKITRQYPYVFFRNFKYKVILLIIPFSLVGSLLLPLLTGKEVWNIHFQLILLYSLIIIFFSGLILNWHYGLKKYEAYG